MKHQLIFANTICNFLLGSSSFADKYKCNESHLLNLVKSKWKHLYTLKQFESDFFCQMFIKRCSVLRDWGLTIKVLYCNKTHVFQQISDHYLLWLIFMTATPFFKQSAGLLRDFSVCCLKVYSNDMFGKHICQHNRYLNVKKWRWRMKLILFFI